jgi:hypothetical protein
MERETAGEGFGVRADWLCNGDGSPTGLFDQESEAGTHNMAVFFFLLCMYSFHFTRREEGFSVAPVRRKTRVIYCCKCKILFALDNGVMECERGRRIYGFVMQLIILYKSAWSWRRPCMVGMEDAGWVEGFSQIHYE